MLQARLKELEREDDSEGGNANSSSSAQRSRREFCSEESAEAHEDADEEELASQLRAATMQRCRKLQHMTLRGRT